MFTTNNFSTTYTQYSTEHVTGTTEAELPDDLVMLTPAQDVLPDKTSLTPGGGAISMSPGEYPSANTTLADNAINNLYDIVSEPPEDINVNMLAELGYSDTVDVALGCVVIVLSIVALFGNGLSVSYFWSRRRKSVHPLLYSLMSIVDIFSSFVSIPVIITLFSSRDPVLFNNGPFCLIWNVLFYYILRISIFIVLLVSVTRTLGMMMPMLKVRENALMISLGIYTGMIIILDALYLSLSLFKVAYRNNEALCEQVSLGTPAIKFYSILLKIQLVVPSILVLVSYIASTAVLVRQMASSRKMKKKETELRYASVTVAIFTTIFLICNLPCFLIQLVYFISQYQDVSFIRGNEKFRYYGHLVSVFLLPLLNSALNPCLYLTRMPQYRRWSSRRSLQIKINGKKWALLSARSQSSVA